MTYTLILVVTLFVGGGASVRVKEITGFNSYASCEAAAVRLRGNSGGADRYAQCVAKDGK